MINKSAETNMLAILLSEDNDGDAHLIKTYSSTFAKTNWVKTLKDAVGYIKSNRNIDIILLDLHLPDATGIQAIVEIRKITTIPVIIITGEDDAILAEEAMLNGADDYLIKDNITPIVLFRRIRMVVGRRQYLLQKCANKTASCVNRIEGCDFKPAESKRKITEVIEKLEMLNKRLQEMK